MFPFQVKNFKCAECGYSCYLKTDLERHINNVHDKFRSPCPVCGKKYSDLRQHVRIVHEGAKVRRCFLKYKNLSMRINISRQNVPTVRGSIRTSVSTSTRFIWRPKILCVRNVEWHSITTQTWRSMWKQPMPKPRPLFQSTQHPWSHLVSIFTTSDTPSTLNMMLIPTPSTTTTTNTTITTRITPIMPDSGGKMLDSPSESSEPLPPPLTAEANINVWESFF